MYEIKMDFYYPYYPSIEELDLSQRPEFAEFKNIVNRNNSDGYLDAQKIISRFISKFSPYQELYLKWSTGQGKTCAVIGITESLIASKVIDRVIVLAKDSGILGSFRNQLTTKCPSRTRFKDDLTNTRGRPVKTEYRYLKYTSFSKEVFELTDGEIDTLYDRVLFIVDEAHNIREKDESDEDHIDKYQQIYRVFHAIKNRRIIMLSATPVKQDPSEIVPFMNLILPLDQQLLPGVSVSHLKQAFQTVTDDQLIKAFTGRVSVLKTILSNVEAKFHGEPINQKGPTIIESIRDPSIIIFPCIMKEIQSKAYNQALLGYNSQPDVAYNSIHQASLFVDDKGRYGQKLNTSSIIRQIKQNRQIISDYSINYATTIDILDANPNKNVLIFNNYVTGSGSISFTHILDALGWVKYTGKTKNVSKNSKRYALFNQSTGGLSDNEISNILSVQSQPDNMEGEYLRVIIASSVFAEGYNPANIQIVIMQTPSKEWVYPTQEYGRALRVGRHQDLLKKYDSITVDIFNLVAVPDPKYITTSLDRINKSNNYSLQELIYIDALQKDIAIQKIERLLEESSIDCILNYQRNQSPLGSRENYYSNEPVNCLANKNKNVILDTYYSYYQSDFISKIIEEVIEIMINNGNRVYIDDLDVPDFQLSIMIDHIVKNKTETKYSFLYPYFKVENGVLYLTYQQENIDINGAYDSYRNRVVIDTSFSMITQSYNNDLDKSTKQLLIERAIYYKLNGYTSSIIEELYSKYERGIFVTKDRTYHILLRDHHRYLEGDKWFPCSPGSKYYQDIINLVFDRFGPRYYAVLNETQLIVRTFNQDKSTNKGRECISYNDKDIILSDLNVNSSKMSSKDKCNYLLDWFIREDLIINGI